MNPSEILWDSRRNLSQDRKQAKGLGGMTRNTFAKGSQLKAQRRQTKLDSLIEAEKSKRQTVNEREDEEGRPPPLPLFFQTAG
jgi:hypothetical protein